MPSLLPDRWMMCGALSCLSYSSGEWSNKDIDVKVRLNSVNCIVFPCLRGSPIKRSWPIVVVCSFHSLIPKLASLDYPLRGTATTKYREECLSDQLCSFPLQDPLSIYLSIIYIFHLLSQSHLSSVYPVCVCACEGNTATLFSVGPSGEGPVLLPVSSPTAM